MSLHRRPRGTVLPEVLLALLLLGLMVGTGMALALDGLKGLAEARRRDQATALATELAGTIRTLPGVAWDAMAPGMPCPAACAPGDLAAAELAAWQARVAAALPAGRGEVRLATGPELRVAVAWTGPDGNDTEVVLGVLP